MPATPDIQAWKTLYASLPEQQLNWMEYQAYEFAGCLLVPQRHLQNIFDALLSEMDALADQARQVGFRRHPPIFLEIKSTVVGHPKGEPTTVGVLSDDAG